MNFELLKQEIIDSCAKKNLKIGRVEITGSSRRGKKDPSDFDILVEILHSDKYDVSNGWMQRVEKYNLIVERYQNIIDELFDCTQHLGEKARTSKLAVHFYREGIKTDLFVATNDTWATSFLYWTGSRFFNMLMRLYVADLNCIYDWRYFVDNGSIKNFSEETALLSFLGLDEVFGDPANRDNKKYLKAFYKWRSEQKQKKY